MTPITPETQLPQGIRPRWLMDRYGGFVTDPRTGARELDPESFARGDGGSPVFMIPTVDGREVARAFPAAYAIEVLTSPHYNPPTGSQRPRLATDAEVKAWMAEEKAKGEAYARQAAEAAMARAESARLVELDNHARESGLAEKYKGSQEPKR